MVKSIKKDNSIIIQELKKLEDVEYGTKELIHGLLIGIVIGFFLAMFFLR